VNRGEKWKKTEARRGRAGKNEGKGRAK